MLWECLIIIVATLHQLTSSMVGPCHSTKLYPRRTLTIVTSRTIAMSDVPSLRSDRHTKLIPSKKKLSRKSARTGSIESIRDTSNVEELSHARTSNTGLELDSLEPSKIDRKFDSIKKQYMISLKEFFLDREVWQHIQFSLTKTEIQLLQMMFGLVDGNTMTRREIAHHVDILQEGVLRGMRRVLEKLPRRTKLLKLTEKYLCDVREEILNATQGLSKRQVDIVKMRFGLVDGNSWTLQQIGQYLNITPQRVAQIESTSLNGLPEMGEVLQLKEIYKEQYYVVSILKEVFKQGEQIKGWRNKFTLDGLQLLSDMSGLKLKCRGHRLKKTFNFRTEPPKNSSAVYGFLKAFRLQSRSEQAIDDVYVTDIKSILRNGGCFIYLIYIRNDPVAVYFMTPSDLRDFEIALGKSNITEDSSFRAYPFAKFRMKGSLSATMEQYRFTYGKAFITNCLYPFLTTGKATPSSSRNTLNPLLESFFPQQFEHQELSACYSRLLKAEKQLSEAREVLEQAKAQVLELQSCLSVDKEKQRQQHADIIAADIDTGVNVNAAADADTSTDVDVDTGTYTDPERVIVADRKDDQGSLMQGVQSIKYLEAHMRRMVKFAKDFSFFARHEKGSVTMLRRSLHLSLTQRTSIDPGGDFEANFYPSDLQANRSEN